MVGAVVDEWRQHIGPLSNVEPHSDEMTVCGTK